ncbi:MAG: autotransporter-associated beta strand repeat-containing protein [Verrucomicrobia bacterium]|nr:autotransporter-associated beta strand repeat-containing protein [Verrucomicrobiota bacterium]
MLALAMGAAGFVHPGSELKAASLTWDTVSGNGSSITGGSGTWTHGLGNWNTGSGDTTWNSATPDDAVFMGTAGTVTLGGDVTVGNITLNTGYTLAGGGNTLTLLNSTITANTTTTISATLGGSTGLIKSGTGFLTLSGANTYTGVTLINSGVLSVTTLANGGSTSNIGASSNDAANLVLNGGTLKYSFGAGAAVSTDRLFSVGTSGGTLDASGGFNINFTNTGAMGFNGQSGARTLTLAGNNANENTLAVAIGDNGGATAVTKTGNGTWALTGANTYTGVTTVSGTAVLKVTSLADGGSASSIGASSSDAGNLVFNGGTFTYAGGTVSTDRLFSLGTSGITLNVFGTGGVNFTNTGNMGVVGSGARTLTLANSNGGASTIAAVIGDNGGATAVTHTVSSSTWILTGANTYTGATTLNGGVLSVTSLADGGSASGIGAASSAATNLIFNSGKLLYTGAGSSTDRLFSVGFSGGTLDASGTGAVNFTNTGSMGFNSQTGARTLTLTGTNTGSNTLAAAIGDNGGATAVAKTGAGTWVLTGTNSYTGATTISGGVLQVGNGGTSGTLGSGAVTDNGNLTFNRSDSLTVANAISGSGSVTQAGAGTTTLSGTNSYVGVTTISGGVLSVATLANGNNASNIGASSGVATNLVLNGGALRYTGGGVSTDRLFSVGTSGGTVEASGTGAVFFTNSGSMGFNAQSGTRMLTLTGTNTGGNLLAAVIGDNGGATALAKAGAGAWALTGSNSYTGATTINGGVLNVTSLANGGSSSNIGASSNAAGNLVLNGGTLQYNNATTTSTDRLFSVGAAGGTISLPVAATLNFTNTGNIGFNGETGARTLTFAFSNSTFGGVIVLASGIGDNGGATSLVKVNTFGTLRLTSDNNTYTGTTTINGGAISIGALGGSTGSIGTGGIIINAGGTLFVTRSGSVTLAQTISGVGGVTSNGNTMLTLSGTNTYTGVTRIISNGGIVTVSDLGNGGVASSIGASSSAAGNLSITNLGTLRYVGTGASTDRLFEVPTGTANPVATLESSGSGALVFTNTGAMGFGSSTGARTLVLGGTNTQNNTMNPIIGDNTGATALTKSGTGTWVLGGANTYTGVTTISGGVLTVTSLANGGSSSNIGASSNAATNLVLNGGTLRYAFGAGAAASTDRLFSVGTAGGTLDASSGFNINFTNTGSMGFNGQSGARTLTLTGSNANDNTLAAVIGDNGGATSVTKAGSGVWVLSGTNTYTGVTTMSGTGGLKVSSLANGGSASSIGASSNAASNLVLNGGTFVYTGGAVSTDRLFSVGTSGATLSVVGSGGVTFTNTGDMGFNGQPGARNFTLANASAGTSTLSAVIGDNGGATSLTRINAGIWALRGASTYTGATTINGTSVTYLNVTNLANGGVASNIGASTNAATNLVLNGGTLQYTGAGSSTDRLFSLGTNGGALEASGTGDLNFTNTGSMGFNGQTGARTLTLLGSYLGFNTIAAVIGDNGGATSVLKNSGGKWVFTGNNIYSGTTTISGGVLQLGHNTASGTTGTGNIVNNGTLVLFRSDAFTLSNVISGTGTVNNAQGVATLSGLNTYTGFTSIVGGTVVVDTLANGGSASNIGASTSVATNLQFNGGTLKYIGAGVSTDRLFAVGVTAVIDASGTGALNFTNTGVMGRTLTVARTLTLTGTNTDNNTLAAVISDNTGATALVKSGAGTWVLSGANTYTGITTVTGGVLSTSSLANGGSASNIGAGTSAATNLVLNGGALKYTGAGASTDRLFSVGTSGGTLDASGAGALNLTNTGSMGFNSQSGARVLTLTGTNTGSNTLAAVIGNNGGATALVKSGSGTWVLTGTNTYSGTTTINAGVLQVGSGGTTGTLGSGAVTNNASLVVNRSDAVTIANTISGSGSFTQAGAGTTTLSGSNSYAGATTITAGVLKVTVMANGGSNSNIGAASNAAGNLVLNGGILQYTGTGASTDRLFSLGLGSGGIDVSGSGNLNFTNTGSMGFNGESGARTLVLSGTNASGVNIIAAAIGDFGGATSVSIEGNATWLLTGANTYTGATTVSSGVLQIGGSNLESAIIVGAHATLELNGLNTRIGSLAGSGTVQNNSTTAATLTTSGNNSSTIFSGVIQDGGTGALSLVKEGSGTFTLTGTNTYAGTTTISAGELQIGSGGTTGTLGTGEVINNASLIINRSDALTIANVISGSGVFTQAGAGTTTLTGDNSYSGSTTLNAGGLSVSVLANGGVNSNLGASSNAAGNLVLNGGTLQYTGAATSTDRLFSVGSSGGTLDASGSGAVNFTNTGSMDFNSQSGIRTLTLTGTNTGGNTLAALIADNGGATVLTKWGAGTWVLTGANSYTGTTTISEGTLQIGDGGTTGSLSTSSVISNNGTLAFKRTDGVTQGTDFASVISGSGGVTQAGSGTLTLNGENTYAGETNVKAGTLEVTRNNALGTGDAGTTVSSGGTLLLNNVDYSTDEALKLNGSGAGGGGALRNNGTSTYTGAITAETNASINAGGGILNLTGGLVKDGTVLTITGGGTVNVSGTGISGASASSDLVVDGTTLVVSADSDYNGPTTVQNAATLVAKASVATTRMDLSRDSLLAGTGAITTAVNQSMFINGTFSVGDPGVAATPSTFALTTSGSGAVVMGADSVIRLDLFTGAGLGNNLSDSNAADSINLHGRIDATAGGTVVIGNPNGMTAFHGGDQWQLVHLNRGDANAGGFISTLALNDSSLHLASGVTSFLDQSTGVFSIIDTNGGLAQAAVEGQALINGANTVTGDLNGHLFNLQSGGGEEGTGSISEAVDGGVIIGEGDGDPQKESPIAKRVARSRQWEVFATVNYGNIKLNPIRTQSGVQVDSWASGVGAERHFSRGLTLGFAASFLQSTQGYTGNAGSLHLEGPALSAYVSYVRGSWWNSLLYSFGTYQMDSIRNPGLPFPTAYGSTRTYTHSVQYNTGWNFRFQNDTLVTGPFIGVDYLHGSVDAYSETGGGLAALRYSAQSFQSLVSRVGWSASKQMKTRFVTITPQVRLSYERQNLKNNNGTSVSLINVPFSAVGGSQKPGQDYLVAGLGVSLAFTDRFSLMLSYQGQFFRHDLQAHFGSIRFRYEF